MAYDSGVFYGGNGKLLGVQCLGVLCLLTWVSITIAPIFLLLKRFKLLRVPAEVQISVHVRLADFVCLLVGG